jgi:hypothetical protein
MKAGRWRKELLEAPDYRRGKERGNPGGKGMRMEGKEGTTGG